MGKNKKNITMVPITDEEYNNSVVVFTGNDSINATQKKVKLQSEESKMISDVNDKNEEVNIVGHILNYHGNNIDTFTDNSGEVWWKACQIIKILNYKNDSHPIQNLVSDCNKTQFENLVKDRPVLKNGLNMYNELSAIYINTCGFFELLGSSRKKEAKEFKFWVNNEVLPSINNTGKYNMYEHKEIKINKIDGYVDWYENHNELELRDKTSVFYIGIIGKITNIDELDDTTNVKENEILVKYGISNSDETKRFLHHKSTIGSYVCVHVSSVFRNKQLEDDVKAMLDRKSLRRYMKFGNSTYVELFSIANNFGINDLVTYVNAWCEKNDFKCDGEKSIEFEREKTRQLELTNEQIKLTNEQIKLMDNLLKNNNIQHFEKITSFFQTQSNIQK
jgi:prophage antirepressor-like protein